MEWAGNDDGADASAVLVKDQVADAPELLTVTAVDDVFCFQIAETGAVIHKKPLFILVYAGLLSLTEKLSLIYTRKIEQQNQNQFEGGIL